MALFPLTQDNLALLSKHGLWFNAAVQCHLPLHFAPPVRLYACTLGNNSRIDAFSYVAPGCLLHAVDIGRYCSIGDGVSILSAHPIDRLTTHPFTYENIFGEPFINAVENFSPFTGQLQTTAIGHDVWIGSGVRIKSGVKIGNGCIIGAGSVVTKDLSDYSIVGGSPAKLIRKRFDDELIERLQRVQWWRYNLIGMSLPWEDVPAALDAIEDKVSTGELMPYQPNWIKLK